MKFKEIMKKCIPSKIIKIHRLRKIKRMWSTCDIRTDCINLSGKCDFGKNVRIPAFSEFWGGI